MAQKSAHSHLIQISSGIAWDNAVAIFFTKRVWDGWFHQEEILILDEYVLKRSYIRVFLSGVLARLKICLLKRLAHKNNRNTTVPWL